LILLARSIVPRLRHDAALVGLERRFLHHRQRPDLAQVQVRIDVGRGDEIATGVDLLAPAHVERRLDRRNPPVPNSDAEAGVTTMAQAGVANVNIDVGHAGSLLRPNL